MSFKVMSSGCGVNSPRFAIMAARQIYRGLCTTIKNASRCKPPLAQLVNRVARIAENLAIVFPERVADVAINSRIARR